MKKKVLINSLIGILLLVFLLVLGRSIFLSNKTAKTSSTKYYRHYAMITGTGDDEFWDKVYASARAQGKKSGAYVERFGSNLSEANSRNELLQMAIWADVDGIIVSADEDSETIDLIDKAVSDGIPVVTVLNDSTGSTRQCFVGNNSYNLGQEYGAQIQKLLETKASITEEDPATVLVLLDQNGLDSSQNLILLGIRETLEKNLGADYPVQVKTKLVDNGGEFSSEESIRDIFLVKDDELPDICVCLSELYTRCAYQAVVDYNKVGTVDILGYYDSKEILEGVSKGIVASTISIDTKQMGRDCVKALEEYNETGYTNGYMSVDTSFIDSTEASKLLKEQ